MDPAHDLDQREAPKGARPLRLDLDSAPRRLLRRPKDPREGQIFTCLCIEQPRISEVRAWRAPVCTEQGNPGIYIQANEWQETYGGNVFVVDELTGRMYVLRGDALERIPKVASHRRRDELSPSVVPRAPGEGTGLRTPTIRNTPIPVAESTRQPQNTSGRATPTMTGEGMAPPVREGKKDAPRNPCPAVEALKAERKAEEH